MTLKGYTSRKLLDCDSIKAGKDHCQRSAEALPSTSLAFGKRLEQAGILSSMGTVGDALDNAVAESFFSTLQAERLDKQSWTKRAELRLATFEYLEVFYNRQRLHSTLGYLSPSEFEANCEATNLIREVISL
jgi:transposase InsO family protein